MSIDPIIPSGKAIFKGTLVQNLLFGVFVELIIMDCEIDRIGYELYGLPEDEIRIVDWNDK